MPTETELTNAWEVLGKGRLWWASPYGKKFRPKSTLGAWALAQVLFGNSDLEDLTVAGENLKLAVDTGLIEGADDDGNSYTALRVDKDRNQG